jgi:hypothetical protein
MTEFAKTPLEIALAVVYAILLVQQKSNRWLLTALAFVAISLTIRLSIDVSAVRDFRPYFDSFQQVKYGLPAPELAGEPYRYLLFRAALLFGDLPDRLQIDGIYYFHFFVVTGFFLWLAYLRDVGFEVKLILFLAFYPVFAYVWIRAGMAYVVAVVLHDQRWKVAHTAFHAADVSLQLARLPAHDEAETSAPAMEAGNPSGGGGGALCCAGVRLCPLPDLQARTL